MTDERDATIWVVVVVTNKVTPVHYLFLWFLPSPNVALLCALISQKNVPTVKIELFWPIFQLKHCQDFDKTF